MGEEINEPAETERSMGSRKYPDVRPAFGKSPDKTNDGETLYGIAWGTPFSKDRTPAKPSQKVLDYYESPVIEKFKQNRI